MRCSRMFNVRLFLQLFVLVGSIEVLLYVLFVKSHEELFREPSAIASSHVLPLDPDEEVDACFRDVCVSEDEKDASNTFRSKTFAVVGSQWNGLSESRHVCLGAQTSLDRLHWLIDTISNWSGPISIALFTPEFEFHLALIYIKFLRKCFPQVQQQVVFHLTHPTVHPSSSLNLDSINTWIHSLPCEKHKHLLEWLLTQRPSAMMQWREQLAYPQNLLRNMARDGCRTEFTFIPDIDMIPMANLDLELEAFINTSEVQNCHLCAYLVPTYEISTQQPRLPTNKSELLQLIGNERARYFHVDIYKPNQGASLLKQKWEKIAMTPKMQVVYDVDFHFGYEPIYVSRAAETPRFDERFVGYGMTRSTQVYEMHAKGFSFSMLSNAFSSHWGFQTSKMRPKWREKQLKTNRNRLSQFKRDISTKYNETAPT